jgi:hypothetical protein
VSGFQDRGRILQVSHYPLLSTGTHTPTRPPLSAIWIDTYWTRLHTRAVVAPLGSARCVDLVWSRGVTALDYVVLGIVSRSSRYRRGSRNVRASLAQINRSGRYRPHPEPEQNTSKAVLFEGLATRSIPIEVPNAAGRPAGQSCRRNRGPVHSHGPDKRRSRALRSRTQVTGGQAAGHPSCRFSPSSQRTRRRKRHPCCRPGRR